MMSGDVIRARPYTEHTLCGMAWDNVMSRCK